MIKSKLFFVWRAAECKALNISEAWYDAEEDLEPSGPAAAADTGHDPPVITKDVTSGRWSVSVATAQGCTCRDFEFILDPVLSG